MSEYTTYQEIGARFGVGVNTVRRWVKHGYLTPIRLSTRTIRFRREQVDALEQQGFTPEKVRRERVAGADPR